MGRLAVYIAMEEDALDELWARDNDDFRDAFLDVEADEGLSRLHIDKIWDALHCTLTGRTAAEPIEGDKLSEAIVGVHPKIYDDEDYSVFVSVIDNDELSDIIAALDGIDRKRLTSMLDPVRMKQQKIYPNGIWEDPPEQLVKEMDSALQEIRVFFRECLEAGLHVLATVL